MLSGVRGPRKWSIRHHLVAAWTVSLVVTVTLNGASPAFAYFSSSASGTATANVACWTGTSAPYTEVSC